MVPIASRTRKPELVVTSKPAIDPSQLLEPPEPFSDAVPTRENAAHPPWSTLSGLWGDLAITHDGVI